MNYECLRHGYETQADLSVVEWMITDTNAGAHHVFYSRDDLCKHQLGFQVVQFPPGGDSGEQVPTAAVLHHQIQLPAGLHHLVQTHYVGMAQLLHAADL